MSLFSDAALKLWVELGIKDPQKVQQQIDNLGKQAENTSKKFDKLSVVGKGLGIAIGAGVAAAATGFIVAMKHTIALGDQLAELSSKTDISAEKLQRLKYAAEQMNGNFSSLTAAVRTLTMRLGGLEEGTTGTTSAFKKLGMEIYDSSGKMKKMDDLFPEMLKKLASLEEGTEKNILGQQLLGKAWLDIKPMVANREELEKNYNALKDYQLLSNDTVARIDAFNDSIARMKAAWQGIWNQAVNQIIPMLEDVIYWLEENADTITNVVLLAVGALKGALDGLITIITKDVIPALKSLGIEFKKTGDGMVDLNDVSDKVAYGIYFAWNMLKLGLVAIVETVLLVFESVAYGFITVGKTFALIGNSILFGFSVVVSKLSGLASSALGGIINMVEGANNVLGKFGLDISTKGLWGAKASVDALTGSMLMLGDAKLNAMSGFGGDIGSDWAGLKNNFAGTKATGKSIMSFKEFRTDRTLKRTDAGSRKSSSGSGSGSGFGGSGFGGSDLTGSDASEQQKKVTDDLIERINLVAEKIKIAIKNIYAYQLSVEQNVYDNMIATIEKNKEDQLWVENTLHESRIGEWDKEKDYLSDMKDYKIALAKGEYEQEVELIEKRRKAIEKYYDDEKEQAENNHDSLMDQIDDELDAKLKALDKEMVKAEKAFNDKIKKYDAQIEAIDNLTRSEDEAERKQARAERIAELEKELLTAETEEDWNNIQKEIEKERKDEAREERIKNRELQKENIEKKKEEERAKLGAQKEEANARKDEYKDEADSKKSAEDKRFKAEKKQLEEEEERALEQNDREMENARKLYEFKTEEAKQWYDDEIKRIEELELEEENRHNNEIFYIEDRYKKGKDFLDQELEDKKQYYKELNEDPNLNNLIKKIILAGEAQAFLQGNKSFLPLDENGKSIGELIVEGGKIPKFATGGIVNRPTLGLIGEAGPELILPLNNIKQNIGQNVSGFVNLLANAGSSMYDYTEAGGGGYSGYGYERVGGGGGGGSFAGNVGSQIGGETQESYNKRKNWSIRSSMYRAIERGEYTPEQAQAVYNQTFDQADYDAYTKGYGSSYSPSGGGSNAMQERLDYFGGKEPDTQNPYSKNYIINITNNSPEPLDAQQINDNFNATMAVMGLNA